ncbi:hypothetical protein WL358_12760 [Staphylococcus epidermidis]|uniref:hypothetical protein n=1 Tax=Staphylococcus epidermidis TaxID=1282 RepID=UPI0030BF357F
MLPTSRRAATNEHKRMKWLAKPMLAKPLKDLINFTLSYKVKCKKGVIFRRKRGGIE